MDTIIYLVTAIGGGSLIVLLFNRTILSVRWWKYDTAKHNTNRNSEIGYYERINDLEPKSFARAKTKRRRFKNINQLSNSKELIDKKVNTCEMIEIGKIISIDSQSVTIKSDSGEYVISTYWIRGYDKEIAVLDTSIRYMHHYQIKATTTAPA